MIFLKPISCFSLVALLLSFYGCAQQQTRTVAFYNVENLFDTINSPDTDDEEFLPDGKNTWNSERYYQKLNHIKEVFNEIGEPVIMGFCEIENEGVVRDLINVLGKKSSYGVVHTDSRDERGIDNAIIYDSTQITLVKSGIIRYDMPEGERPSRDIIWAQFNDRGADLFVMVNHWPSRSGGQVESEPKRLIAAQSAYKFIDSLLAVNKKTKIIFMGDLNDHPTDLAPKMISSTLNQMITAESGTYPGTYNYRGEWGILDHIMVSKGAYKGKGAKVKKKSGKIHALDFLLTEYKGSIVPNRTYAGSKYLGGYSDHLPVSIQLK